MSTFSPKIKQASKLIHEGLLALSEIEQTGICIDYNYVKRELDKAVLRKKEVEKEVSDSKLVRRWKRVYGEKFKLSSNDQLADILFNHLGYEPVKLTDTGKPAVDHASLEALGLPEIEKIIRIRKFEKVIGTYLGNIAKETTFDPVSGHFILHCFFNLHTVVTYRSSSDKVNFQNLPIRDPEWAKLIRSAFIPRPGHMILEIDFSGIEVRIAYCYHKDPVMGEYLNDPTKDMHRDCAMDCYLLPQNEVSKDARYAAKNKFVFPQFYGSWYKECAKDLWNDITALKLKTNSGVPLKQHLKSKGITTQEQFENHIRKVEDIFWNKRFKQYAAWKKAFYTDYVKRGYFDTLTGFRCGGLLARNEVLNYPVQGAAFHCLLWCLIQMHREIKELGLKSRIIGQIHDSIVLDVHPDEVNLIMSMADELMKVKILQQWKWIIVPLDTEAELTPIDKSWYEKKPIENHDCTCGSRYMWKKEDKIKKEITWTCPICDATDFAKAA